MSVNKYKMRHQAKLNNKGAKKTAKKLLENPDKIIKVILLGNLNQYFNNSNNNFSCFKTLWEYRASNSNRLINDIYFNFC